jgi:superfamily II DNA or RNA helicase
MIENNDSYMFYPEITDNDFNEKIYLKKEFRDTEIKEKNIIHKEKGFTLDPHQIFLKNYISPDTPYNGILIYHGTGVGKTCSAISIAEGFKKTLKNMNKKILILTTLKDNFIKQLYNFEEERNKLNPEDIVQCTGRAYELGEESMYLTNEQKEKEIIKSIKSYYQFFGYNGFANYILSNTGGWNGDENSINEKVKAFISKEFDDRVIIIDEIQNIKTDKVDKLTKIIQPVLQSIIKYGKNIKLILMSATPMFDRPDEIIFYINLLLENDGRKKINKSDIFNYKDGTLKKDAEDLLRKIFTGYVSYVRAEKPFIFPFRVYPQNAIIPKIQYYMNGKNIEKDKQLKYTYLILCQMTGIQQNTYLYFFEKKIKEGKIEDTNNLIQDIDNNIDINNNNNINIKKNENENERKDISLLRDLLNISNITYPINNNNSIGSFNKYSINVDYDNGLGGYYKSTKLIGTKKRIQYKYQSHAIFNKDTINEAPFTDEKYLNKYSTKFSSILNTIKKSSGLIFIYSYFIEQGALPLALILEQNGYTRECTEGEEQLLDYTANKLKKGGKKKEICYLCSKEASDKNHIDEKSPNYHIFKRAKYILFFGEPKEIIKIKKQDAVNKFCTKKNKYGEDIKIFIGTKTVSEGLDFKRIRQIHILDPWYNLSRNEQIIGRGIRNYSHKLLLPEERNVEIYQYASILSNNSKYNDRESVDLKNYRLAENKDIIIKKITRIMKESAVDCVLFKNTNVIQSNQKVKQITSSNQIINIPINDKPFSPMCDYQENCNYICNWEPNPRKKYPINTDTYNLRFSANDIAKIKKDIKYMFRENIVYHLNTIEENIINKYNNIDKLFIYTALEELVDNKTEAVYDKFSRKGYIIYRGDYYIFQPFDLDRDELPMIYRMYPSDVKPTKVNLDTVEINYNNTKKENENKYNKFDEESFTNKLLGNIELLINIHIKISTENKKKYIWAVIGYVIDSLIYKEQTIFIKNILIKYLQKSNDKYIEDIISYLNNNLELINYYSEISYDKSKIKNNIFVGFIINNSYYIIDSVDKTKNIKDIKYNKINFIECSKDTILKIKAYRNILKKNNVEKDYNIIYGILEDIKNIKKFKIIDKSVEENIFTKEKQKSKRSIITGRTCSTYHVDKLNEIRTILGLYEYTGKRKREFYCEELEIYFRYKQLLNNDNKIWFMKIKL